MMAMELCRMMRRLRETWGTWLWLHHARSFLKRRGSRER
jgi:hypothetical protein